MLGVFVARVVFLLIRLMELLLLGYCIISWLPLDYSNPLVRFFRTFVEPFLAPIRNFLLRFRFFQSMPIDFSPLVAYLLLDIVFGFVIRIYK